VTSAKGIPYTLHVDLPKPQSPKPEDPPTGEPDPIPPIPPGEVDIDPAARESNTDEPIDPVDETTDMKVDEPPVPAITKPETNRYIRQERVYEIAKKIRGMYCPCAGFAYNTLSGERNIFVGPCLGPGEDK
jgi:hypothetical protein